jgi:ABC-2 type transport system ATP-binding protein
MNDALAIETRGLGKRYRPVVALDDLDLRVPRGSVTGFLGPNGAGKTTAMRLLLGLARPTSGSATILGRDVATDATEVRRRVGFLAQDPRFFEHETARATLRFTARFFFSGPARAIEERVDAMLDLVDLADKADRPVRGFSGGERQRLGIAQAQLHDPEVLIMDEPAAALDPVGRHAVLAILGRLRTRSTVLFSTHILDDVQRVADHVAILDRGRLIAQAPTRELLAGDGAATFVVRVRRAPPDLADHLRTQPWVASIDETHAEGDRVLRVVAADEDAAEAQLLRTVLAHPEAVVVDFRRHAFELEEVFMNLVQGRGGAA